MNRSYMLSSKSLALFCVCWATIASCAIEVWAEEESERQEATHLETPAEYQKRVQTSIRTVTEAQASLNQIRAFTIKVIDQDGRPVAGIRINGYSKKYLRVILPTGKMFDSEDIDAVTDQQGVARTKPLEGGAFHLTLNENKLPEKYDGRDSVDFVGANPDLTGRADKTDRSRLVPGIDWIFYIHRFIGPKPLVKYSSSTNVLPTDATEFPWAVIHPIYSFDRWAKSKEREVEPFADFRIRFWRNPQAPWTTEDPNTITMMNGKESRLVNALEPWWVELEVVRGGLQLVDPPAAPPELTTTAPAAGYADHVVFASDGSESMEEQARQRWYWWRRSGNPTRYALVAFKLKWVQDYDDPFRVDVKMSATMFINPAPDDRLIERPISRNPTWITDLKDDLANQWIAEPAGDPDPTIEHVAPRVVPGP